MKARITSKGQITIPIEIRRRLGLLPGQILEFEEDAPFLKAVKVVDANAMRSVIGIAKEQLRGKSADAWIRELRGDVELPPKQTKGA